MFGSFWDFVASFRSRSVSDEDRAVEGVDYIAIDIHPCSQDESSDDDEQDEEEPTLVVSADLARSGELRRVEVGDEASWKCGADQLGAVVLFNNDGDSPDAPAGDHEDDQIGSDADLEDVAILRLGRDPADLEFRDGTAAVVWVAQEHQDRVRIFSGHLAGCRERVGPNQGYYSIFPVDAKSRFPASVDLGLEALSFPDAKFDGHIGVHVQLHDGNDYVRGTGHSVLFRVAPFIMSHHLQPVEHVYIIDKQVEHSMPPLRGKPSVTTTEPDPTTRAYVQAMTKAVGKQLRPLSVVCGDNWARDMFYNGHSIAPGMQGSVLHAVRCPSDRGRSEEPVYEELRRQHVGPGRGYGVPIIPRNLGSDLDSGGNVMCSPPLASEYPFGRIVYGHDENRAMSDDLLGFFQAQGLQDPFPVDTSWLQVGHADEVLTFIPWPRGKGPDGSTHGFRVLVPCPALALRILESSDARNLLFRSHHVVDDGALVPSELLRLHKVLEERTDLSAGSVLANEAIRAATGEVEGRVDTLCELLTKQLRLGEHDIIRVPVLFQKFGTNRHQRATIAEAARMPSVMGGITENQFRKAHTAFTPNMVNMLVMTEVDGPPRLIIPKPHGPSSGKHKQYDCAFEAYLAFALEKSGAQLVFVDDLAACHCDAGEIHCTTFEVRAVPEALAWWEYRPAKAEVVKVLPSKKPQSRTSRRIDSMRTLEHGWYLDDEVMRRFYGVLRERHRDRALSFIDPAASFLLINSPSEAAAAGELASMTQNDPDWIFFPVNNNENVDASGGTHWTLILYRKNEDRFFYYDSLNKAPSGAAKRAHVRLRALYQTTADLERKLAPQQQEAECGVMVLLITEHLCDVYAGETVCDVVGVGDNPNPRGRVRNAIAPPELEVGSSSSEFQGV